MGSGGGVLENGSDGGIEKEEGVGAFLSEMGC